MREIHENVAKDCLPQLLVIVEQGESIAIVRDGRAVAHLIPSQENAGDMSARDQETLRKRKVLAENFIEWRAQQAPISESLQDILDWRSREHR